MRWTKGILRVIVKIEISILDIRRCGHEKTGKKKHFSYTQCDDFAAYLQEMSRKGFHFTEWKGGLSFEKGEPEDVTYQVEVFADGEETDQRPSRDTEEYREYCEAAGFGNFWMARQNFAFSEKRRRTHRIFSRLQSGSAILQCGKKAGNASDPFFLSLFLLLEVFGNGGALSLVFSNAAMFLAAGFAFQILMGAVRLFWLREGQKKGEAECLCGGRFFWERENPLSAGIPYFQQNQEIYSAGSLSRIFYSGSRGAGNLSADSVFRSFWNESAGEWNL